MDAPGVWAQTGAFPLNYLQAFGQKSATTEPLLIGSGAISIAVILIIGGVLLVASFRGRSGGPEPEGLGRSGAGLSWIYVGVAISTVVLFGTAVWTMVVIADVRRPSQRPAMTIEVTGYQWWWEARYLSNDASRIFRTANEIHIPVGVPVSFQLRSADVIHSFWIPALAGKTDTIPGQTNIVWVQADRAGRYRGQCSEFCGAQHAHMGFFVIADEPEAFERWYRSQLNSAPAIISAQDDPDIKLAADGQTLFAARCGLCHTVRGTAAGGELGPDLSHIESRGSLAAATLPNGPAYLSGWIVNTQGIKPSCKMPAMNLSGPELNAIRVYLATLD